MRTHSRSEAHYRLRPGMLAGVLLSVALLGCAAERIDYPEWLVPVGRGTPAHEYTGIPVEARDGRVIGLEADLVIGSRGDDPNYSLYRPGTIALSRGGDIYVLDAGNHRIQVFDPAGEYLRTIGREGTGPGEIERGGTIAVAGERLVRVGDGRISVWSLAGEHLSDRPLTSARLQGRLFGLDDGRLVTSVPTSADGSMTVGIVSVSAEGELLERFGTFPVQTVRTISSSRGITILAPPGPQPAYVAAASGTVYLTPADEYQVYAYTADGPMQWALRVAWPRRPVSDDDRRASVLRSTGGADPPAGFDTSIEYPEYQPALGLPRGRGSWVLHLDGHEHLWVYPLPPADREREELPVDVYSPAGDRLYSGLVRVAGWSAARGDHVFRVEEDERTGENQIVRYRLLEPF